MFSVVTGRFNNETLEANYNYRQKHGFSCMYCVPNELSPKISYNTPVFVIEMNNSINKIEGIGLIQNKPTTDRYYKVHKDGNTNRYIYIGKHFVSRRTIEEYNPILANILDECLFKGRTHSKRGSGLSIFPEKLLQVQLINGHDIKKEIKTIFQNNFRENTKE
jgi:hypothetical protein